MPLEAAGVVWTEGALRDAYSHLRPLSACEKPMVLGGRSRADRRRVVVKLLLDVQELRAHRDLDTGESPHIPRVLGAYWRPALHHAVHDGAALVMEHVDGLDLRDLISALSPVNDTAPLPLRPGANILRQALRGLAFIHAKGYAHRDIKPVSATTKETRREEIHSATSASPDQVVQSTHLLHPPLVKGKHGLGQRWPPAPD